MLAKDAKYGFERLIDLARLEPVLVVRHGRRVVLVLSVQENERLKYGEVSGEDKNLTRNSTVHSTGIEEN